MVENTELKSYIIEMTSSNLLKFEKLAEIYPARTIKKKLNRNIKKIFTNEKMNTEAGYYNSQNKEIHLIGNEKNKDNPKDIEKNKYMKSIILHECIHAFLLHSTCSTGILSVTNNGEIGRGLNEGLTNWIVEKCGIKAYGYEIELSVIQSLEFVFGEEKILNLAKGNLREAYRTLKFSNKEGENFFKRVDEITSIRKKIRVRKKIISELDNLLNKKELTEEQAKKELREMYHNYDVNLTVKENIKQIKDSNVEDLMDYCETVDNGIVSVIDTLVSKYAEPFLQREYNKKSFDKESYINLTELYKRIWNIKHKIENKSKREVVSLKLFEGQLNQLANKLYEELLDKKEESFSTEKLENDLKLCNIINRPSVLMNLGEEELLNKRKQLYQKKLKINFEDSEEKLILLEYLRKHKKLQKLEKYCIQDLNNGSYIISESENKPIVIDATLLKEIDKTKPKDFSKKEFSIAMENFKKLKTSLEEEILNIQVLDSTATLLKVETKYENKVYMLNREKLSFEEILPKQKVNIVLPRNTELPAVNNKKQSLWNKIKSRLLKKEIVLVYENEAQNKPKDFIERLKFDGVTSKETSETIAGEKPEMDRTI